MNGEPSRLLLRVTPGAKRDEWLEPFADGRARVKLRAPATEGRANEALVAFVAKSLGVPKSHVRIARGAGAREKALEIDLPAGELAARLKQAQSQQRA